jgi:hypothetical protein
MPALEGAAASQYAKFYGEYLRDGPDWATTVEGAGTYALENDSGSGAGRQAIFNSLRQFSGLTSFNDLMAGYLRAVNQGEKPKPIDPTERWADEKKMEGAHLKAAAGMGMGGMFGFGANFGLTSGLTQGGMNPLSPNMQGASAIPTLPQIKPIQGPPNLLSLGGT